MPAYSGKAQPYLDAIATGMFSSVDVRRWVLRGTDLEGAYSECEAMFEEQRAVRWAKKSTIQPFWANYWCGKDAKCTCRIEGSKGLESDAIFFVNNAKDRRAAIHVEFKHPYEEFGFGQPESYPLRAACFARTYAQRPTVNAHHDWTTVVFCGSEALNDPKLSSFQRVISHGEAAVNLVGWPLK